MSMTIKEIQQALIARGYDLGKAGADGDPGPLTLAATRAFQRVAGLIPDGIAGELTQAKLKAPTTATPPRAATVQPAWLPLAAADIGTVEGIGKHNNPKVIAYFRDAGFPGIKDDATAWCAAFVGAQLHRAGIKPSGSLAARSYEHWGVGLKAPVLGCVATKKRNGSSWQGHVGFVVGASKTKIFLLGGNQSDSVSIEEFERSEFTSWRWPSGLPVPSAAGLPTTIAGAKKSVKED